ncbi:MAG: hypothetical protein BWY09_01386 [Candidatus Hydrogenedentes bacterium ADurb.Bin179]|nr:MAG: hypothetical protein BWY09_01386 [Candidatus Hydrogenedentes bacterium ADurb.Bin179]
MNLLDTRPERHGQAQVLVQLTLGQKIKAPDFVIFRADTVDTAEALDQPHRVPVQIIIDDHIAILQVQPFRHDIGGDQQVDFRFI